MSFSGHQSRKRFGQHWLKDKSVLGKIIVAANLKDNDRILEIGPGRGALTERLLDSPVSAVHAIEIDRDLINGLRKRFWDQPRFSLAQGDILKASLKHSDGKPLNKVVANIPYNITGPLLERLLGSLSRPPETSYQMLVLLLQKEVADRILAMPGQSNFSAMSVRLQLLARSRSVCLVPPNCFQPPPKVNSEVVLIEPLAPPPIQVLGSALVLRLESLLRQAFMSRRKMLRNSLGSIFPSSEMDFIAQDVGISLNQRPQELNPQEWLKLAKRLIQAD